MSNGSARLRTPLKLLAIAAGLLLLSLAAIQSLPRLRGVSAETTAVDADAEAVVSADEPIAEPTPIREELIVEEAPTLSGSVSGQIPPRTRTERKSSTIDVGLRQIQDESVPLPPQETNDDALLSREIRQLQERLDEMEREVAEATRRVLTAESPQSQHELAALQEQYQDQQTALRDVVQRLAVSEDRWRMMQESLKDRETKPPVERSDAPTVSRISIKSRADQGKTQLLLSARDASLPELLSRLGEISGVNLLVSPDVSGTVSLHLTAANGEEALDAVCRAHQCRQERQGNFLIISRGMVTEHMTAKPAVPEMMSKLYRLQHLSGAEIRPFVQPLLTPGLGTVSFATIRERVARTEYRDPPRAILVKDTVEVLAAVDRLILELDQPPAKGKALRPISRLRMPPPMIPPAPPVMPLLPTSHPSLETESKLEPVAPPSEAWPSRRAAAAPEPVLLPDSEPSAGPALLPTGSDLPGPCLDCEVFEPPLVHEEAQKSKSAN